MKKIISLLLFIASSYSLNLTNANAYDFTDKIYGKVSVRIGYNFKHHVGSYMNTYLKGYEKSLQPTNKYIAHTRSTQHYVTFSIGYNFYYRLNDLFHPFVGYEATGMLPIGNRTFAKQYPYRSDAIMPDRMLSTVQEYFIFNQRTGVKINIINNFSVVPYSTLGFNVLKSDRFVKKNISNAKNDVGFTIGCGIEALFLDRFSFALEYRFARNRGIHSINEPSGIILSNNAMAKFGYYFL